MRLAYLFLLLLCFGFQGLSQDENWQQQVDYQIQVTLLDSSRQLEGVVRMNYHNNSPHALDTIWIHLWPNAYSRYNTDFAIQLLKHGNLSMDRLVRNEMGAIGKTDFRAGDQPVEFRELPRQPDIGYLVLNDPLPPGSAIEITTPFKVKIPRLISRMGYSGDFFAITQWFPKAAVYDRKGWHAMPYLEMGEFYADFGKYMVTINVPERFKVAATGNPTNEMVSEGMRTIIYQQDDIHDFAWFASPDFKYASKKIALENGHEVLIQTYYLTEAERWQQAHLLTENAVRYFSGLIGPYPYHHCTIVEAPDGAGDGMEYPTIASMEDTYNSAWMETVIAHEVAHNWWQGMLASNERDDPWIDEGFTSYYELRYKREAAVNPFTPLADIGRRRLARFFAIDHLEYADYLKLVILDAERHNEQQPAGLSSDEFTLPNYIVQLYEAMPQYLVHLSEYIGQDAFDACIRSFYTDHRYRHIDGDILRQYLEACSGKDLQYFFEGWIGSAGIVDHKVRSVKTNGEETVVQIRSRGDFPVPVPLTLSTGDRDTTVWVEAGTEEVSVGVTGVRRVWVDRDNLSLDYNRSNNSMRAGFLGKIETIRPQLFAGLEDPRRSQLFFSPVIAGNTHDKFMLGMAFYNRVYPAKNVDWTLVPLYAFGSRQANGILNFSYYQNIRKNRMVQLEYKVHFKTFSYNNTPTTGRYINFVPSVKATILPPDRTRNIHHEVEVKHHQNWAFIEKQDRVTLPDSSTAIATVFKGYVGQPVGEMRYSLVREDVKTPITSSFYGYNNKDHVKFGTTLDFKVRYGKIKSFLSARFFLEGFVYKKTVNASSSAGLPFPSYRTGLGGTTGATDYLFEHDFIGRSESTGFASHQVYMDRGQFKFASPGLLRANALATAVNLRADFPSKWIPIKLYIDFGIAMNEGGDALFAFQMGGMFSFLDEAIEVYFPFFSSSEIKRFYDLNLPKYKERITFSFDLEKLNPHKKARDFRLM